MIEYGTRDWLGLVVRIRGTVTSRVFWRSMACVAIAIGAVYLKEMHGVDLAIPALVHTILGVALGLLLVFRTNTSYDRYWEGRKLLGGMVNRTRDLARQTAVFLRDDLEGRRRAGCQVAIEFRDPDGHNLEIYWGLDQVPLDGTARAPQEWTPTKSLEEAVRNAPPGQDTTLAEPGLMR